MKFLKVSKQNPSDKLAYHLHKLLAGPETPRSLKITHASNVTRDDFCPRRVALMILTKTKVKPDFVKAADQLVWRQGRGLAGAVIDWLADSGVAVGDWKCWNCGHKIDFTFRPKSCDLCGCSKFKYSEIRVTSQYSGISSGIDLLSCLPSSKKLLITEIKTLDKEKFKEIKMPYAEHRTRTKLYLKAFRESDHPYRENVHPRS